MGHFRREKLQYVDVGQLNNIKIQSFELKLLAPLEKVKIGRNETRSLSGSQKKSGF